MKSIDKYNLFLKNKLIRKKYKITFEDGTDIIGIPTLGSTTIPTDETEFSFIYEDNNGIRIHSKRTLSSVKNIEEI